ncbi:MAG: radical SAM protein [Candidatus Delongbacteria bacterium]|nr:radical SAM protein [Candidatus Delongbacteria bacterium]
MIQKKDSKKSVYISTPFCHCALRKIEATKLKNYFTVNNYEVVNTLEEADYHICITCAVTKVNVNNYLDFIKDAQKSPAELIVMGCLPGTNPNDLDTVFKGKKVITKNINEIDNYFPGFTIKFHQVPEVYTYDTEAFHMFTNEIQNQTNLSLFLKYGFSKAYHRYQVRKRQFDAFTEANKKNTTTPGFLQISSGCANNCTYCNIREAIGKIKSKPIDSLTEEYRSLLQQGYRNFHFVTEDLCSYGLDINSSLGDLLNALSEVDKSYHVKWTLNGVNPSWIVQNHNTFESLFKSKIWEIMIAIESGSDRLIKLMNRHYKIHNVEKALISLRKINPGLKINALFIVGFPSETDADFEGTLHLFKSIGFDSVTLTDYSEFQNLASANVYPKVSKDTMRKRRQQAKKTLNRLKTPLY